MSEEKKNKPIDPMIFEKDSPYYEKPEKELINPMTFDVPTKSFEDKIYIVLMASDSNDELFDGQFKICHGRTACYRYIEHLINAFGVDLDVHNSKIITETKQTESDTGNKKYYLINYDESLSIYAFCKSVESYYGADGFNIDDTFSPPTIDNNELSNEMIKQINSGPLANKEELYELLTRDSHNI